MIKLFNFYPIIVIAFFIFKDCYVMKTTTAYICQNKDKYEQFNNFKANNVSLFEIKSII